MQQVLYQMACSYDAYTSDLWAFRPGDTNLLEREDVTVKADRLYPSESLKQGKARSEQESVGKCCALFVVHISSHRTGSAPDDYPTPAPLLCSIETFTEIVKSKV